MFLTALFIMAIAFNSHAYSFKELSKFIEKHPRIEAMLNEVESIRSEGKVKSSWGDPRFAVNARNFPKDSLANDETPMTGVEYSLSQSFPLTGKFGNIEDSYEALAKSKSLDAAAQRRALVQLLWNYAAMKRNLQQDAKIIEENIGWLGDMLKVSNRLYANGKVSQQAVLELEIRKSELEAQLSNKKHSLKEVEKSLGYLAGGEKTLGGELALESVPWNILEFKASKERVPDETELSLKEKIKASDLMLSAQKLSYVPDVTLSVGYVQRDEDVDPHGDFVSAGVSFSLPLSQKESSEVDGAFAQKLRARNALKDYKLKRKAQMQALEHEIAKMRDELKIIDERSLVYAGSSRKVTSKSYGLGSASYIELLQAELKYQNLLLRRNDLQRRLTSQKVEYLYLRGDRLYEE